MAAAKTLFVGCMTGTSVDGLDLALIAVDDKQMMSHEASISFDLPQRLRSDLLLLGQPESSSIDLMGQCDRELGIFIGQSINEFLRTNGVNAADVAAIGSHGQTIRHRPPQDTDTPFTLQIGDANQIVEQTGIVTITDFRRRDMAASGNGAPLAPAFHEVLFRKHGDSVAILNIGGISNVSFLGEKVIGFDTGPGNALMDCWFQHHHNDKYDSGGAWARAGLIDQELLKAMLSDPYFSVKPPKSTGREYFNLPWIQHWLAATSSQDPSAAGYSEQFSRNVQSTLVELTAVTVARALAFTDVDLTAIAVCGGGRLNAFLMERLTHACSTFFGSSIKVARTEHWGVDGDFLEAAAFAWLAYQRLNHRTGNLPSVTGALGHRILGAVYTP